MYHILELLQSTRHPSSFYIAIISKWWTCHFRGCGWLWGWYLVDLGAHVTSAFIFVFDGNLHVSRAEIFCKQYWSIPALIMSLLRQSWCVLKAAFNIFASMIFWLMGAPKRSLSSPHPHPKIKFLTGVRRKGQSTEFGEEKGTRKMRFWDDKHNSILFQGAGRAVAVWFLAGKWPWVA